MPQAAGKPGNLVHPALVFNPHAQFEQLRATSKYEAMKNYSKKT